MAGNGGIIGPTKVINTPQTKVTSVTATGQFTRFNCTVTSAPEILVVAGGAGGGNGNVVEGGGGGGAGGYRTATCVSISARCTAVTVGGGGAAITPSSTQSQGNDGTDSVFGPITSDVVPVMDQVLSLQLMVDQVDLVEEVLQGILHKLLEVQEELVTHLPQVHLREILAVHLQLVGQVVLQLFPQVVVEPVEQEVMQVIFLEEQLEMVEQGQQTILQEVQ